MDTHGNGNLGLFDPSLHLIMDDADVRHRRNARRVWAELRRRDEPVSRLDRPWEAKRTQLGSVVFDEGSGTFKCW